MTSEPTTLARIGAWGQLVIVALALAFWVLELPTGFLVACLCYFVVTVVGIVGIARTESAITGTIVYPFLVPGFVPLDYFATR